MIEIELYDTKDGRCPLQEYLDSLEPKLLAKILRTIDLLENNGTALRGPYSEPLGNGLFELELFLQMGLLRKHRRHLRQK